MKTSCKNLLRVFALIAFSGNVFAQPGTVSKIADANDKISGASFKAVPEVLVDITKPPVDTKDVLGLTLENQEKKLQDAIAEGQKATENIQAIQEAEKKRVAEIQAVATKMLLERRPDPFMGVDDSGLLETIELIHDLFFAPEFGGTIGVDPAIEDPSSPEYKERQNQLAATKAKQEQEQKAKAEAAAQAEAAAKAEKERLEKERMEKEYRERMERHHSEVERFKREKENYRCPF